MRAVLLAFQQSLIVLFLTDACPPRTNLGSTGKHYSSHYSSHYRFAKPLESGVLFPEVKSLPNNWNQFKLFKFFRCQNVMLCDARCPSCLYTVCICHSTAVRFMLSFLSFKSTLKPRSSRRLARYADAPARIKKAHSICYACYIWRILRHLTHWIWHMPPISARCELFSINKNHAKNTHLRLLRPMPVCKPSSCMKVQIGVLNAFLMHPLEFPAQFVHPVRVASCRFRD